MEVKRMTAQSLVNRLRSVSEETQKEAVGEIRVLSKGDNDIRIALAGAGAVPYLLEMLSSADATVQENSITALLNLSVHGPNREVIMSTRGAVDAVTHALKAGRSAEAKQNAAALVFSLMVVESFRPIFGDRPAVVRALLDLIREGKTRCTKDALKALFHLALHPLNRPRMVSAGVVAVLFSLIMKAPMGLIEDATAVLAQVAGCAESDEGFRKVLGIPVLLDLLDTGSSSRVQENVASALLNLAHSGGERVIDDILDVETSMPVLSDLLRDGTPRCKSKVSALLQLFLVHERRLNSAAF
uniref:U-box domain-containing protein n=1 Tax=Araucaria cunninghamii TaxID=56994 RepID=A0A0D6QXF9_ARACU